MILNKEQLRVHNIQWELLIINKKNMDPYHRDLEHISHSMKKLKYHISTLWVKSLIMEAHYKNQSAKVLAQVFMSQNTILNMMVILNLEQVKEKVFVMKN